MINLFWYKMPNGEKNFGDELGPYIVEKLTGQGVKYIPIVNKWYKVIPLYLLNLFRGNKSIRFKDVINSFFVNQVLISIGSIITSYNKNNVQVWGSGMLNKNDIIKNADFLAVRGIFTQKRIEELGYRSPSVLGDPAMLLPLIIKPIDKKFKLGVIPHYIHYDDIKNSINNEDVLIINLLDDINKVVENITSCEMTLTTSLHGLIVSHSYKIPSLWVNLSVNKLAGDNIKFRDYFSSIDVEYYDSVKVDIDAINKGNFKFNNELQLLPKKDVLQIQKGLLEVFPYKLLDKYEKYI